MQAFYTESTGLTATSADSVINYYLKFASFHGQHPECEAGACILGRGLETVCADYFPVMRIFSWWGLRLSMVYFFSTPGPQELLPRPMTAQSMLR